MKHLIVLSLLTALVGCGDDDGGMMGTDAGPGEDGGPGVDGGPMPNACSMAIAERQAIVADMLDGWPIDDNPEMVRTDGNQALEADYAGRYRDDLANHPGCQPRTEYTANASEPFVRDNEATVPPGVPASIEGYPCAAKEYTQASEDTDKPIVILVHGNSSGVTSFEEYFNASIAGTEIQTFQGFPFTVATETRPSLVTALLEDGFRVIAFDARIDLVATGVTDLDLDPMTGNPFLNIDHGWPVPMLQSLVRAVMTNNPERKVSLLGHSLGVTVIRDTLRRLFNEHLADPDNAVNPFAQLQDVLLLSGANHGVFDGNRLCETFDHMRGTVGCEMGDRTMAQVPTEFNRRLNGPQDLFAAPCADGTYAFGMMDQCGGNTVQYTTVTMEDLPDGELQDEFVSEESSGIDLGACVDNQLLSLTDFDDSGYFITGSPGFLANHFGSARAPAGIALIRERLND